MYKCRLCGEKFETVHAGPRLAYVAIMSFGLDDITIQDKFCKQRVYQQLEHHCADKSFGLADFLGFKMEEIDKGEDSE